MLTLESVQSPTLHTDLGIDRNELVRRLKQNIQSGQQDGYPFVLLFSGLTVASDTPNFTTDVAGWRDCDANVNYSTATIQSTSPIWRLFRLCYDPE
jgi:hypothetical protein